MKLCGIPPKVIYAVFRCQRLSADDTKLTTVGKGTGLTVRYICRKDLGLSPVDGKNFLAATAAPSPIATYQCCQIFLGTTYLKRENIYQITINYT
jgi:hypothetical protein